jgi:cellulose synthase/poly-beta-1,6-N-acetylglucosamine synthase-like glycosyltransferase
MIFANLFYVLGLLTLLVVAALTLEFARGNRLVRQLRGVPPFTGPSAPSVSIVIAARDESRSIENALQSVLGQDYSRLEIIVVNDRSSDDTSVILERMTTKYPRLRTINITDLPPGWLGKNHALQCGAELARGEFLLFTDADVMMDPTTVSRAVQAMTTMQLDHLTVAPQLTMRGLILNMFSGAFTLFFGMYARPWKVRDPRSNAHVGIGAFNLLRRDVYRRVGGHSRLAMRPDDDMKLGKLVKMTGHRQDILSGDGSISVEWYHSVGELVRGLEKNSFAAFDYSLGRALGGMIFQFLIFIWPVLAMILTEGVTRILNVGILLLLAGLYTDSVHTHNFPRWHAVGLPAMAGLFLYIIGRAILKTIRDDGIDWRGTHYSLASLRANKI